MSTSTPSHAETIYDFIAAFRKERGYAPTQEEIAAGVGLSGNTTRNHLLNLQSRGLVDWTPRTIRTIRIIGPLRP